MKIEIIKATEINGGEDMQNNSLDDNIKANGSTQNNINNSIPEGKKQVNTSTKPKEVTNNTTPEIEKLGQAMSSEKNELYSLLPNVFKNYTLELSEFLQVDANLITMGVLTAIATAVQGKFIVQRKKDHKQHLNIALIGTAKAGDRKSPTMNHIYKPITDYEIEYNQQNKSDIEKNIAEYKVLVQKKENIEKELSRTGKQQNNYTKDDLDMIIEQITNFDKPINYKRFTASDTTPEALIAILDQNQEKTTVLDDEGQILKNIAGQYSNGKSNISVVLQAIQNNAYRYDRIGRAKPIYLKEPLLTAFILIQPKVLEDFTKNEEFRDKGLIARFIKCQPISQMGYRTENEKELDEDITNKYKKALIHLLEIQETKKPITLSLSEKAKEILNKFQYEDLEPRLIKDFAHIDAFCSKLPDTVARIAGLLHLGGFVSSELEQIKLEDFKGLKREIQNPKDIFKTNTFNFELEITSKTMQRALNIGKYLLKQELSIYKKQALKNTETQRAEFLLEKIRVFGAKKAKEGYTATQLKQHMRNKELEVFNHTDVADIKDSIDILVNEKYLIQDEKTKRYHVTNEVFI